MNEYIAGSNITSKGSREAKFCERSDPTSTYNQEENEGKERERMNTMELYL